MSGGSHNYLYSKDLEYFFTDNGQEDLDWMATSLIDHGYKAEAEEVLKVLKYIEQVSSRVKTAIEPLRDVFHAVEWRDSADIGDESLHEAIEKHRNRGI